MTQTTSGDPSEMNKDAAGRYALVNGLNMYYEIHGAGRPLVLLHGSMTTIFGTFRNVLHPLPGPARSLPSSSKPTGTPAISIAR